MQINIANRNKCTSCRKSNYMLNSITTVTLTQQLYWNNALKLMHSQYEKKCSIYWRDEIAASKGNTTRLWRTFRGVLGEAPCDETGPYSAEDFASFFRDKVDGVRASTSSPIYDVPLRATPTLAEWTPVSPDETEKLISAADPP